MRRRLKVWLLPFGMMVLGMGMGTVSGQDYPTKPIRVLTSPPGGGSDFVSRLIAQGLSSALGQQVIVENRPGGVGPEAVAKSAPDGYNLLYYGGSLWLLPLMRKDVPYDALRDFAPISLTSIQPAILVVHPALPVKNVKDFIALAKAHPGQLNYSSGGAGSSGHLSAELFKAMAKVNLTRIPYKGQGPATLDLIAGHIQLTFGTTGSVLVHVKSGKLRALGVTTAEPSALAPGLPTIAASGLPGYESVQISGLNAPAKTPAAIINRLNQESVRFLNRPDIKEKLSGAGVEVVASTPEEFTNKIKSEIARMGKVIKEANIREE
jgi:tripartite-type tricarboxylate transporter receptor subunit TctC